MRLLEALPSRVGFATGDTFVRIILLATLCAGIPAHLDAQTATATLSGVVVDETEAGVPNVSLTLVNFDTAVERKTAATGDGAFVFTFVPPGRYTLSAVRDGFAPADLRDVVLNVGDAVGLRIVLKVGVVTDAVTVTAGATPVAQSGTLATSIDERFVDNLPLNGRSVQSLVLLAPGAIPTATTANRLGQVSVNGQRESTNALSIDGVSANLGIANGTSINGSGLGGGAGQYFGYNAVGGTNSLVSLDALQEFTIQTSTFAPEFGRTPGAQVSMVTRSGNNTYHGSVFGYFRDDALDATDWFLARSGLPPTPLRHQQLGGTFGGPVRRGRSFFFGAYEGLRLQLPQFRVEQVPTLQARARATGP